MIKRWLYCSEKDCDWEADSAIDADVKLPDSMICPECHKNSICYVAFDRRDWMQWGAELTSGRFTIKTMHAYNAANGPLISKVHLRAVEQEQPSP